MRDEYILKIKHKKKGHPSIKFGTVLPNNYKSENTCLFYFNIKGSFNDPSNIYLTVFVNDYNNTKNTFLILKNNQWIEEFPNKNKLIFPKNNITFDRFGWDFMVIYLFFNVFLCKINMRKCENAKIKTKRKNKNKKLKIKQKSIMKRTIKL